MINPNSLKILSLLSILTVLSVNPTMAETSSDSIAPQSKFRFGFLIGPIASYPVLSINQHDLNRVYEPSELPFINGNSKYFEKVSAKLTGGLSIGFSLTYSLNDRFNINTSPSVNLITSKINSIISSISWDTINNLRTSYDYKPSIGENNLELPISLETNPFKSKPNFLASAGLSFKHEINISNSFKRLEFNDGSGIRTKRYFFDFFLSTKFLKPKKQNGIELKFSYSLRDKIYREDPQRYLVQLPVNSIHLFTSSLLFHIR